MGYAPAAYYLGLAHEKGLIEGEKPDPTTAAELYMVAASERFAWPAGRRSNASEQVVDLRGRSRPM